MASDLSAPDQGGYIIDAAGDVVTIVQPRDRYTLDDGQSFQTGPDPRINDGNKGTDRIIEEYPPGASGPSAEDVAAQARGARDDTLTPHDASEAPPQVIQDAIAKTGDRDAKTIDDIREQTTEAEAGPGAKDEAAEPEKATTAKKSAK